jgi:hypothetical protein
MDQIWSSKQTELVLWNFEVSAWKSRKREEKKKENEKAIGAKPETCWSRALSYRGGATKRILSPPQKAVFDYQNTPQAQMCDMHVSDFFLNNIYIC